MQVDGENNVNLTVGIPEHRRYAYISTTATQTAIAFYTLLSLLYYEYIRRRSGKFFNRTSSRKQISAHTYSSDPSSAPNHNTPERTKSKTSSPILRIMCIVSTILTIVRILLELIELAPNSTNRGNCQDYIIPIVITYSTALASIYFILWYRLYIFLSHPAMKHLTSKLLKVFGFFVLFLIFAASFLYTILYLTTTNSADGYGGCTLTTTDNVTNRARFIILTFTSVIAQGALLGLFIYPLLKHRATMQSFYGTKSSTSESTTSPMSPKTDGTTKEKKSKFSTSFSSSVSRKRSRQMKRQMAIIVVIKRVMLTAVVCILSDIITGIMATTLRTQARIVTNLMFDSNLLVNLLCVIISFKDWRSRISFNCYKTREKPLPVKAHSRSLQIKTGSNNNLLDSVATPATPISPGIFSNGTTTTPIYSANIQSDQHKNVFFYDEKSGSTSNTGVDVQ